MQDMKPDSGKTNYFRKILEHLLEVLERERNSIKLHVVLDTLAIEPKVLCQNDVERIVVATLTNPSMRTAYDVPQNLERIYSGTNYPESQNFWLLLCQTIPDWQPNSKKSTGGDDWTSLKNLVRRGWC